MAIKINPLLKCHNDIDDQMAKLSAWVQTLDFVLEGLEAEGAKAGKSEEQAVVFANRYTVYSEMLFLALSGLQDCKDALEKLSEKEFELIRTSGGFAAEVTE